MVLLCYIATKAAQLAKVSQRNDPNHGADNRLDSRVDKAGGAVGEGQGNS